MKKLVLFILIYFAMCFFFLTWVNAEMTISDDNADYTVTIPAKLSPGEIGSVVLNGLWSSEKQIVITVDKTITLVNELDVTERQTLNVYFNDIKANGNELETKMVSENISIEEMPQNILFGSWNAQLNYTIEIKDVPKLYNVLKNQEGIYTKKYTGEHQDSYTKTSTHDIYHYYAETDAIGTEILNKNNVIFANHCWQMIRTTDTGGVKLIYNGEPDNNGSCGTNRGTHVGYSTISVQTLNSNYYYATDYIYDSSTSTFSLSGNKTLSTWNDSTYNDLIGNYTCMLSNESETCTELYLIESYYNSTQANIIIINSNSHYSQFGTMKFNLNHDSAAYVGYMYGDVYISNAIYNNNTINYHYGESVTYSNGTYTLVNPKTFASVPDPSELSNNHYICLTQNSSTCESVGYVHYYQNNTSSMYYIILKPGETDINTAFNNMLNKNITSSAIKNAVESWYEKYLLKYNEYIEQDTIYCFDRSVYSINGWNPNGGTVADYLYFKNYDISKDLGCTNNIDKFSVNNINAKLKYSVGLATSPELNLLNNQKITTTNIAYWLASPYSYTHFNAHVRYVYNTGEIKYKYVSASDSGVRPVISLNSNIEYISGDGSTLKPYVIE